MASLGLLGYFTEAEKKNTRYRWYFYELLSANGRGIDLPLRNYNREVVKGLCQRSAQLCFGLGIYRVVTFKDLSNPKYVQYTQPTATEIQNYLFQIFPELAVELGKLIDEYRYSDVKGNAVDVKELNIIAP